MINLKNNIEIGMDKTLSLLILIDDPLIMDKLSELSKKRDDISIKYILSINESGFQDPDTHVDCVVSGLELTGYDTEPFLRNLRRNYPQCGLIIITDGISSDKIIRVIHSGADYFISHENLIEPGIFDLVKKIVRRKTGYVSNQINLKNENKSSLTNKETGSYHDILIIIIKNNGLIISCNDNFLSATGYKLDEIINKEYFSLFYPDLSDSRNNMEILSKDGNFSEIQHIITKGGEIRIIQWFYSIINSFSEIQTPIVITGIDITDFIKAHEDAEDSSRLIQAFLKNDEALISVRDLSGKYILANTAIHQLFNLSNEDIINKTDYEIFPEITADQLIKAHQEILNKNHSFALDETFQTSHGIRHYLSIFFPIRNDKSKPVMTGMIATDITRIKEMEARIKRSHTELIRSFEDLAATEEELQEKYKDLLIKDQEIRNIFDNIHDVFYRVDDKGYIRMVSPSAKAMFGYPSHLNLIDQKVEILWVNPEDRTVFLNKLLNEGFIHDFEFNARKSDRTTFWVSMSVRVLTQNGQFVGYEGIFRDISERKAFEQERFAMLSQIEKNLGDLAILNDGIRNPLTVILGYSSFLNPDLYKKVMIQVKKIDDMVFQLDKCWVQSSHVLNFINRHYGYEIKKMDIE